MVCGVLLSAYYYYHLVDYLVKNVGYTRDVNIRGAPYDFRKAPSEFILLFSLSLRIGSHIELFT